MFEGDGTVYVIYIYYIDYSVLKKLPEFSRRVIEDVTSDVVSCNVPSHLNVMQLVPLHKRGSVNERTNFREVFLSSCIGKLCVVRLRAPLLESLDTYFLSNMCGGVKNRGYDFSCPAP